VDRYHIDFGEKRRAVKLVIRGGGEKQSIESQVSQTGEKAETRSEHRKNRKRTLG